MADHALGQLARLDHRVEIDAGLHAHLLAEEHHVLGGDVAGGALVRGERAAAHAGHRGVEAVDADLERGDDVGDGERAGVVEVELDRGARPAVAHRADQPLDLQRVGPAHGVGQADVAEPRAAGVRLLLDLLETRSRLLGVTSPS